MAARRHAAPGTALVTLALLLAPGLSGADDVVEDPSLRTWEASDTPRDTRW